MEKEIIWYAGNIRFTGRAILNLEDKTISFIDRNGDVYENICEFELPDEYNNIEEYFGLIPTDVSFFMLGDPICDEE